MSDAPRPVTTPLADFGDVLGGGGRLLAVVVAVLYGVGFLVVNAYLGGFGVRDLEPLRARYVASAIPFLLLAGLAALAGVQLSDRVIRIGRGRSAVFQALMFFAALGVAFVAAFIATFVALSSFRAEIPLLSQGLWRYLLDLGFFGMGAVVAVVTVRARRNDWHTVLGGFIGVTSLTSVIIGVVAYANTIYPSIPTWLGGGKPEVVQLVVDDIATVCPPCGVDPVKLIDDDSNRIVVLIENPDGTRKVLEIARFAVRSIIHSPTPRP